MDTQTRLRKLMQAHGLDQDQLASLLQVSEYTVTAWLRPRTSKAHRSMPANTLRLLQLLLADKRRAIPD